MQHKYAWHFPTVSNLHLFSRKKKAPQLFVRVVHAIYLEDYALILIKIKKS
jgi:hypothetical protein